MSRTASDLKRAGWPVKEIEHYQPWLAIERYNGNDDLKILKEQALKISREIADMLKTKYGAGRVVLFGSLAHGAWFTPRSDIDIYTEGIPANAFFKAEADTQKISNCFKLDLVDHEDCTPEMISKIKQEGIDLC